MEVDVVVRDDRDLRITGVVECLAKERLVVCEAAVANVLAGADSDLVGVVLPAAKRGERLADDDLRGEADVVVHVLFAQADGLFTPDFKRDGPQPLALEGDRHQTAECMRGVRDEDHLVLAVGFREFLRIGIGQLAGVLSRSRSGGRGGLRGSRGFRGGLGGRDGGGCWRGCCSGGHRGRGACSRGRRRGNFPIARLLVPGLFPSQADGLDERTHADAQRPLDVALIDLQDEGRFGPSEVHEADDLVGEVGVVAAAEAHELDVFQIRASRGDYGGAQHTRVEVVHHVEAASRKVDLVHVGHRIGADHGDTELGEGARQLVVDQVVVLVRPACEHDGEGAFTFHLVANALAFPRKLGLERLLRGVGRIDCLAHACGVEGELACEVLGELAVAVFLREPVEQRRVEGDAEALLGVVRIAHDDGVALHHRAHRLACFRGVFRGHRCNRGHEDAVDPLVGQIAHVSVDKFSGEAHGV